MCESLNSDCVELVKMLTSIIVTTKQDDKNYELYIISYEI